MIRHTVGWAVTLLVMNAFAYTTGRIDEFWTIGQGASLNFCLSIFSGFLWHIGPLVEWWDATKKDRDDAYR